jgi:hypothetical protein
MRKLESLISVFFWNQLTLKRNGLLVGGKRAYAVISERQFLVGECNAQDGRFDKNTTGHPNAQSLRRD